MQLPRRAGPIAGVAALCLLLGAVAVERVPQHAAGQGSPHGVLPVGTVTPQVRPFHDAPGNLPAPAPRRAEHEAPKDLTPIARHGGPGADGKPEHHSEGPGNGSGQDNGHDAGHSNNGPDDTSQP